MLTNFFNQIDHQFNTKISRINSGNGGGFLPQLLAIQFDNGTEFIFRKFKLGYMKMAFFMKGVALQPPNKMALLNGNIVTYSMLLVLYDFKLVYHFLFGENAFL